MNTLKLKNKEHVNISRSTFLLNFKEGHTQAYPMMWDVPREVSQFVLRKDIVTIALKQTLAMAGLVGNKNIKGLDVYTYVIINPAQPSLQSSQQYDEWSGG